MSTYLKKIYFLVVGILLTDLAFSQVASQKPQYEVEAGTYLATSESNPFWIRSNQYGEIPLESNGFTLRAQVKKEYESRVNGLKNKWRFSYGYGAPVAFNAGAINQLLVSELYGKIRFGAFELFAGRKREIFGIVDTTLTAGSYVWSGNALPVPKVEISIPNYTPILKNGLISIKGNYAHGWLGTGDSVSNVLLHQKSLYVRLGKPSWRFKFYGGFSHQVQWGGQPRYPRYDTGVRITKFGTDWESYRYVVTVKSLYTLDTLTITDGTASAEGGNRVGNHLGSIDLALEYENDDSRWLFYRQSFYEAGALFYLNNISDGLNGISYSRKNAENGIIRVVFEYLQTSNQGGPIRSGRTTIAQLRGEEDYFNNGRYLDGWTYKGQTIGTPFIMPLRYTTGLPQNIDPDPNHIINNRVDAYTLGIMSRLRPIELLTRVSVSQNFGNYYYDAPIDVQQISMQQQVIFPVGKYLFTTTIAYDNAGVLKQNFGLNFLVKRHF